MKGISGSPTSASMSIGRKPMRLRFSSLIVIMFFLVIVFTLISMTMGGTRIPLHQLFGSLIGSEQASSYSILLNLRLPRTLVAAGAGIALAVSGVLIQASVRNPLADSS